MNAIKKLRMKAGISQTDFAKQIGVTQGAVSQWESGVTAPGSWRLVAISEALNCSLDDVLGKTRKAGA